MIENELQAPGTALNSAGMGSNPGAASVVKSVEHGIHHQWLTTKLRSHHNSKTLFGMNSSSTHGKILVGICLRRNSDTTDIA